MFVKPLKSGKPSLFQRFLNEPFLPWYLVFFWYDICVLCCAVLSYYVYVMGNALDRANNTENWILANVLSQCLSNFVYAPLIIIFKIVSNLIVMPLFRDFLFKISH